MKNISKVLIFSIVLLLVSATLHAHSHPDTLLKRDTSLTIQPALDKVAKSNEAKSEVLQLLKENLLKNNKVQAA